MTLKDYLVIRRKCGSKKLKVKVVRDMPTPWVAITHSKADPRTTKLLIVIPLEKGGEMIEFVPRGEYGWPNYRQWREV